ncbi:hypothetical protein CYY_005915 [Polysphondylium violaceum]|uniref:RING-type domain-containing protein n=1 Tax=Polysphondylium violaceum TaxID=133409 RepID=A0A8J4PUB4_9MYCE|nr:hypothetical protein CYY_005915 [Polysphondylium violaceum]
MFFPLIEIASRYKKNSNNAISNQSILSYLSLKFKSTPTSQSATNYDEHVKAAKAVNQPLEDDYYPSLYASESNSGHSEFDLTIKQQRDHSFKSYFSDFYPLGSELDYIEANKQIYSCLHHYPQFIEDDSTSWYFSLSDKDKYSYEVVPSKNGIIMYGFVIAAKYPNHKSNPSIIGKFVKQQLVKGGDIAYNCKLNAASQTISFYINGNRVQKQKMTFTTQPAPGTRLYYVPIVSSKASFFMNVGQSCSYYKIKNTNTILNPPILLHRRCDVLTDLLFKELLPSLELQERYENNSNNKNNIHPVKYTTTTATSNDDYLKQVLSDVQPVFMEMLNQSLIDYNIEDILISKLCTYLLDNEKYTKLFVDLLFKSYTSEIYTTLIHKIFNAISLKCRPSHTLDLKPILLFQQLLKVPRIAHIFYSHPYKFGILDQIFFKGQTEGILSFLMNRVEFSRKPILLELKIDRDRYNYEKDRVNKDIFEFLIQQYTDNNETLLFDWIRNIIANELNFSKKYLAGKKAEEYCFPFLLYIFTIIADHIEPWMKSKTTLDQFPIDNLLFDSKWNESEYERLGGLFSHLTSDQSRIPSTLDQDLDQNLNEILFGLSSILLNISFSKQLSKISMDVLSPHLVETISRGDNQEFLKKLYLEISNIFFYREELREGFLTFDYLESFLLFQVKLIQRCIKEYPSHIDFIHDYHLSNCVDIFQHLAKTDEKLLFSPNFYNITTDFLNMLFELNNCITEKKIATKCSKSVLSLMSSKYLLPFVHTLPTFLTLINNLFIHLSNVDIRTLISLFDASLPSFLNILESIFTSKPLHLLKFLKSLFSQITESRKLEFVNSRINLLTYLVKTMPHLILENETFLIIAGQFYLYIFEKVSLSDDPHTGTDEEKSEREKEKQFFVQLFYKLLPSIYYLSLYESKDPYYDQLFKRQFSRLNLQVIVNLLAKYNPTVNTYDKDKDSSSGSDDDDDDDDDGDSGIRVSLVSEFDFEESELVNGSAIRQSVRNVQTENDTEKERPTRHFHNVSIKQPLLEFFNSVASNLPPSMSTASLESLGGGVDLCSICYSYPIDTEFIPCKHQSCHHCITLHLLSNDFCFYCRKPIKSTILIKDKVIEQEKEDEQDKQYQDEQEVKELMVENDNDYRSNYEEDSQEEDYQENYRDDDYQDDDYKDNYQDDDSE